MNKKQNNLIHKINNGLSGKELFNNKDWYKINRLILFYTSDEEAVMFSVLCDVENRWDNDNNKRSFKHHLDGYFLFTVKYASLFLNKSPEQQRRALKKLEKRNLISIKYWSGKKRTIKINWDFFTKQYNEWISEQQNYCKKRKNIDPFNDMIDSEKKNQIINSFDSIESNNSLYYVET